MRNRPFLFFRTMEEIFKNLEPPFDGYKISNFGRIINPRGKECKPTTAKKYNGQYAYPFCNINIRRKSGNARKHASLAVEVYKAFGENYKKGMRVYHKDGDVWNCRIDNLFISTGYNISPTAEQIEVFNSSVVKCVKHFVGAKRMNSYAICDIDDVMGESYRMIWEHLSQWKTSTSFYQFCIRYVRWAFLAEYAKKKKELEFINTVYNTGKITGRRGCE